MKNLPPRSFFLRTIEIVIWDLVTTFDSNPKKFIFLIWDSQTESNQTDVFRLESCFHFFSDLLQIFCSIATSKMLILLRPVNSNLPICICWPPPPIVSPSTTQRGLQTCMRPPGSDRGSTMQWYNGTLLHRTMVPCCTLQACSTVQSPLNNFWNPHSASSASLNFPYTHHSPRNAQVLGELTQKVWKSSRTPRKICQNLITAPSWFRASQCRELQILFI